MDDQYFADAISEYKQYNVMPVYGLNVHSLLKHETVVLSLGALDKIESQILSDMHSPEYLEKKFAKASSW